MGHTLATPMISIDYIRNTYGSRLGGSRGAAGGLAGGTGPLESLTEIPEPTLGGLRANGTSLSKSSYVIQQALGRSLVYC